MVEKTFAILKPETVARGLVGEVLRRIEQEGFRICAAKLVKATEKQAEKLYEMHVGKPFYKELLSHITSGPIFVMVVEGESAVQRLRALVGATNPAEAEKGTIRGDYGLTVTKNAIHAADSQENARRETAIFFAPEEILDL
ncbi:nucleoside-diphosphate kinase [Candidatus Hecatella orcuttiae]|jgi:nucleoside-diphosphate kinase|uniref:nucleoside-diphosphate kinase n=1 Tax=Candidatus Hecatella orcuttiae TaxID=1935119 RepID=UPI0028681A9A|nr:nucleoside-diphosphate kinase [Candidatus Hecatella orcuttiae]